MWWGTFTEGVNEAVMVVEGRSASVLQGSSGFLMALTGAPTTLNP